MNSRRARSAALTLPLLVVMGATGVGGYALVDGLRAPHRVAATPAAPPPSALVSATVAPPSSTATPTTVLPVPTAVAASLAPLVTAPALGGRLLASVLDAQTGTVLYGRSASTGGAPASTAKLLTAAALLATLPATYRITTTVVDGGPGTVVLVGAGDPTLTGAAPGKPGAYPGAARLSDLAAAVRKTGLAVSRVVVDDSAFSGPAVSPDWAAGDVPSSYASPITAVMADGGRAAPGDTIRSNTPDLDAGQELANLLGVPSASVSRGSAPAGARVLASVQSPPLSELIGQMLQNSDNVIAECLARQVAIAKGAPASFLGAAAAIRAVLSSLGVDPGGQLTDGSGLAASDRLTPATLTQVLDLIVSPAHPELHDIVTALPVAAWSGTLAARFVAGAAAGAGVIRAKTGTLSDVSTLAGIVHDRSGRLLVFAFLADQVVSGYSANLAAESALDRIAAGLAGCGCT